MPLVLGSAGHIDHGKTSLVRTLTGIDCDRLEEEKRRGITIELGFAHFLLPNGERLGIVDVPGHERFVKNMVAGAVGIDFVMLVIAADEGIMPQTREHIEICSLLGIKHGFVALTKIDMVDEEWLELAKEDVQNFLKDTFLADSPIFPVSSITKEGIEELREYIVHCSKTLVPQRESSIFRLPVDRIFSMKGHGTVVTGTLLAGKVQVGDEAVFMPDDVECKIRAIQWHGNSEDDAAAGQRCALNVQNIEVGDVQRGSVLTHPKTLFASNRWFVMLHCLSSAPRALRARTEIHLHHGTREVSARLYFFDRDRLNPGENALTEVRFTEPMVGVYGDRCVIRAYSPLRTVAGGVLVHPFSLSSPLRRKDLQFEEKFKLLSMLDKVEIIDDRILSQMQIVGIEGLSFAGLMVATNSDANKLDKSLQKLIAKGEMLCFDKEEKIYIHKKSLQELVEMCLKQAASFHAKDPLKPGMARGVLCPKQKPKLAHLVIERCLKAGSLVAEGDVLRLAEHSVKLGNDETNLKNELIKIYNDARLTPPNLKDVLDNCKSDAKKAAPVLKMLVDEGKLVRVKDNLYYDAKIIANIREKIKIWFESHDDLDHNGLKEILGNLSRKYLISLLEYMDRERITIRIGDKRQWRGR